MPAMYAKDQPSGFKNHIKNVAIVGASGHIGSHITSSLLATGKHTVTALTRKDSDSEFPAGINIAHIDYDDPSTLVSALKGQDFLIISLSHFAAPGTQDKLLKAASDAGVEWVIPNSYGQDLANPAIARDLGVIPGLANGFKPCENAGPQEARIYIVTSFWYEFAIANAPGVIGLDLANKKITMLDDGNTKINMSSLPQAGRAVANLLGLPILPNDENDNSLTISQWRNKPFYTASYLISQRDILASLQRQTGTTDADWTIESQSSESRYKQGLGFFGSGDIMKGMGYTLGGRVFFPNGDGQFQGKEGWANDKLGLNMEELDEGTKKGLEAVETGKDLLKAF